MSIKDVRHRLLYFKDLFQGTVYTALSNARWLSTLTPLLAIVVRPLLGITLSSLALLQTWTFFNTPHKNIDGWMSTVSSLGGALFNNIAAFGGFIARLQGVVFVAAPWLFVAGFALGTINQLALALINARRAYESPAGSDQRQHYLQSMSFNLIMATQLASCVTAIVLFNLFPAYTALITGFAVVVVAVNIGSCIWRYLSGEQKKGIKEELGFGKSEHLPEVVKSAHLNKHYEIEPKFTRLFTTCNHSAVIRTMSDQDSKNYLSNYISKNWQILKKNQKMKLTSKKLKCLSS